MENLHRGTMIVILWLICGGFPIISSSDDIIEIAAGRNITLVPKYIGGSSGISWWFKGSILADIRLEPLNRVYFYPKFDHFKDRTTINGSTGHMTIRTLTEEDSGHYRAEAVVNNTDQVTRIRLIVFAHPVKVMEQPLGSSVSLTPKYSGTPTEVSWWTGPFILARAQLQPSVDVANYCLRRRAFINPSTGILTIGHLNFLDTADYRAEVLVNNTIQYTLVKLTVKELGVMSGMSGGAIAVLVVSVLIILIAILGTLSCKCGCIVTRFGGPAVVLVSARCITTWDKHGEWDRHGTNMEMAHGTNMEKTEIWHCDCRLCQSSFPMQQFQEKTQGMEVTNDSPGTPMSQ